MPTVVSRVGTANARPVPKLSSSLNRSTCTSKKKGTTMPVRPYNPEDYVRGERIEFDYPENFPEFAKGSPIIWPKSAHPGGLLALKNIWTEQYVPAAFRPRLCFGKESWEGGEHEGFTRVRGVVACASCELPKSYLSRWCISCGGFFIQDFIDTRYCPCYPHCWDCLSKLSWPYCPDHATPNQIAQYESSDSTIISPPAGFNPLKISDEDLEDFISNELGI